MKIKLKITRLQTAQIYLLFCGCILMLLFITPYILFKIMNTGSLLGLSLSALICAAGLFLQFLQKASVLLWHKKYGRIVCIVIICLLLTAIFLTVSSTLFMAAGFSRKTKPESTVIVLGCQVRGQKPGIMLQERINAAYEYLNAKPDTTAILSGGKGSDEQISEAECMFLHLVNMGIDSKRLFREAKSTSTHENITFSKEIIKENNLSEDITIITNDFHCFRACNIAKNEGLCAGAYSAKTHWYIFCPFYLREICAIIAQQLL